MVFRLANVILMLAVATLVAGSCISAEAKSLLLDGETKTIESPQGNQVKMRGRSELHITGGEASGNNFNINLESEDSWVFFHEIRPSVVADDFLKEIKVNGKSASLGNNVRVVQYGEGTVVIPHGEDFEPLEVFSARSFTGTSQKLKQYTEYDEGTLGPIAGNISSFILKRGYMATFAENEDGTGASECYVAQDHDLEVPALPAELDNCIKFVRIFPWRWVSKKGSCDVGPETLNAKWHYNWSLSRKSTLDWEYVAIKQQPYWPGLDQDWKEQGVNHLLGYNEPNNHVEDAYKNLNPPGSVDNAIARWPELLKTGLRLGSPAVTDGGRGWILDFMKKAEAKNLRVDFVAIHYYRSYWKKDDPEGAARQLYGFLKDIHEQTGKPIWLTEWNNGANWTDSNHDPSPEQQERAIRAMVKMLDKTPWVERYAIYSNVEDFRKVHLNGSLTAAGRIYHNQQSPIGFQQPPPDAGFAPDAVFLFDNHFIDSTGNGNNAKAFGSPEFIEIGKGSGLVFDGENDYLQLPPRKENPDGSGESEFGFSAWINWAGGEGNQHVFNFGNHKDECFYLTPCIERSDGSNMEFVLRKDGKETRIGAPALTPGKWTHVAISASSRSVKLYVDGKMVKASSSMGFESSDSDRRLNYIGRGQASGDRYYRGQIFKLRLMSDDLSDMRVRHLAERVTVCFSDRDLKFSVSSGMKFSKTLSGSAKGGKGKLRYAKSAGPDWLTVHPDGRMEGRPSDSDKGHNAFIVLVEDEGGRIDAKTMMIEVRAR